MSKRGHKTLLYRGFELWFHTELKSGSVVWRCVKKRSCTCKAVVITKELIVVGGKDTSHTHEGNNCSGLARRVIGEMKGRLADTLATPGVTQAVVASTLRNEVLMALPKKSSLSRVLRRHRQHLQAIGEESMPPLPMDTDFVMPPKFADFVLFDSGPGDDRIIMLGCAELLDGLARATMWLADGTFKTVPSLFFQL